MRWKRNKDITPYSSIEFGNKNTNKLFFKAKFQCEILTIPTSIIITEPF